VQVRAAYPPGHVRTPHYTRGRCGIVEAIAGAFANPEELAYGRKGEPPIQLYRVRFEQSTLWPDYEGAAHDTLVVDIYEHWLEPAPDATTRNTGQHERARKAGRRGTRTSAAAPVRAEGTKPRRRDARTYAR
jgi:nitrile hydratase